MDITKDSTALKVRKLLVSSAIIGSMAAYNVPAFAQIDEVVVTARKAEENLQDVPISVTAFTGEIFERAGLVEFTDIARITPNFDVRPNGGGGGLFPDLTIRGQTAGFITLNTDQAVGINVNGAPITRGTNLFSNLFDIESIEVLKGPQGTLFGKNTTGGVVNVVTTTPKIGEFSGYGKVTVGNFDRNDFEAVVNVPIGETAALRFGAASTNRDGYSDGIDAAGNLTGRTFGDDNEEFYKASLLVKPNDRLSIRINADYHEVDETGVGYRFLAGGANVVTVSDDFFAASDLQAAEPFVIAEETNINATISYDFGDVLIESISSYRDQEADNEVTQNVGVLINLAQESEILSQELRLSGQAFADKLAWQVGTFLSSEEGTDDDNLLPILLQTTAAENTTTSVFAQGTYAITDRLNGTVGLRYTDEKREVEELFISSAFAPPRALESNEASFDAVSWLASLDYKVTDDVLTYLNVSRGFRSGAIDQDNVEVIVQPEFVLNYEVGVKADLLDNRLRFNTSAFYSDYTDIQVTSFDPNTPPGSPLTTILTNAAEATIFGFETEVVYVPIDNLTLNGAIGYTNAQYDEFNQVENGMIVDSSEDPIGGPEWQVSASARYELDLANGNVLGFQANYSWIDEEVLGGPEVEAVFGDLNTVDSYGLLNAQIDFDTGLYGGLNVALFGTNILDEEYFLSGLATAGFGGAVQTFIGPPAQYGVRVKKSF